MRVEERTSRLVEGCYESKIINGGKGDALPSIPEYHTWIVTICHFGADACKEYTGDKFCVTWEVGEYVLIRAYNKEMIAGGNKNKKTQNYNQTREAGMPRQDLRGCHCRKIGGGER